MIGKNPTVNSGFIKSGRPGLFGIPSEGWHYWNGTNWDDDTQLEVKEVMLI